ncbi:MAG: hypothetical protein ABIP75_10635 [Pyrinomonadaceae bacterium]
MDEVILGEQVMEFELGVDPNSEHYRHASFCRILERTEIDDLTMDRFVELAELDPDQVMAEATLGQLVRHCGLTTGQIDRLCGHPAFATPDLQRICEQTRLLRGLDSADPSREFVDRCISVGDSVVQRKLLERIELTVGQLMALSEMGANRAVRNLALAELRRKV